MSASRAIYELRTYAFKATKVKEITELTKEKFHLRTNHSILNGYWFHEFGGTLNAATHIWQYDSLKHRAQVRAKLANDPDWISQYVSGLLPCLESQHSQICEIPKWAENLDHSLLNGGLVDNQNAKLQKPGVFELITLEKPNNNKDLKSFYKNINSSIEQISKNSENSNFVTALNTVVGNKNEINILFRHADVDDSIRDFNIWNEKKSTCMIGAPWSPLK